MSINLHFDEEKRDGVEHAWAKWWAGELPRPIVHLSNPARVGYTARELSMEFLRDLPVDEVLDVCQAGLENTYYYADALPTWRPWFGPGHSIYLGGEMTPAPEQNTVWFDVDEPIPFEDLHFTHDPNNIWWKRAMALRAGAAERWKDKVSIGPASLASGLQTLAFFRTTDQLLADLLANPEEVVRQTKEMTDVLMDQYEQSYEVTSKANRGTTSWGSLWSPDRTFMHECDFACMISPEMYERFVVPDMERCMQLTNHTFYHLDGPGAFQHLDRLLSWERLLGIQWVPGSGEPQASEWLPLLKRIKDAGKLCQVFVDPDGARKIVRELGGRGFCIIVTPRKPIQPDEAEDFLAVLAAEDADAV